MSFVITPQKENIDLPVGTLYWYIIQNVTYNYHCRISVSRKTYKDILIRICDLDYCCSMCPMLFLLIRT